MHGNGNPGPQVIARVIVEALNNGALQIKLEGIPPIAAMLQLEAAKLQLLMDLAAQAAQRGPNLVQPAPAGMVIPR